LLGLLRHLAQVEADLSRGQWSDPRLGRTSFAEWAARWEATTVNLRSNTRATYRNLLHRYLLPTFGPVPLADLDAMAVRAWLAKLEHAGVGEHAGQVLSAAVAHPGHGHRERVSDPQSLHHPRGRR
jgi:hypothetical protein